jgi:TATA-binding protein-associated factor Taf7
VQFDLFFVHFFGTFFPKALSSWSELQAARDSEIVSIRPLGSVNSDAQVTLNFTSDKLNSLSSRALSRSVALAHILKRPVAAAAVAVDVSASGYGHNRKRTRLACASFDSLLDVVVQEEQQEQEEQEEQHEEDDDDDDNNNEDEDEQQEEQPQQQLQQQRQQATPILPPLSSLFPMNLFRREQRRSPTTPMRAN